MKRGTSDAATVRSLFETRLRLPMDALRDLSSRRWTLRPGIIRLGQPSCCARTPRPLWCLQTGLSAPPTCIPARGMLSRDAVSQQGRKSDLQGNLCGSGNRSSESNTESHRDRHSPTRTFVTPSPTAETDPLAVIINAFALDTDGRLVFMAESAWTLKMAQENHPEVKFHFTSEI